MKTDLKKFSQSQKLKLVIAMSSLTSDPCVATLSSSVATLTISRETECIATLYTQVSFKTHANCNTPEMALKMQWKVANIVAMDGFHMKKKFPCKELVIVMVGAAEAKSFFDIRLRWDAVTEKDKKAWGFVRDKIHKLPFGVLREPVHSSFQNWKQL